MPVTTPAAPLAAPSAPDRPDTLPQDAGALLRQDPEIAAVLLAERDRQAGTLQLVAAENFASPAVLAALGSPLANKYAEGYPGARHHGGCAYADAAERIAVTRATALFGAEHANVQPHSGSSAVLAAYAALLRPGDTVLAMDLAHGGHLTHGAPGNFSGRWFDFTGYGTDPETGLIDYPGSAPWPAPAAPRPSSAAPSPLPATRTTRCSGRSPTRSARTSSSTPRTRWG